MTQADKLKDYFKIYPKEVSDYMNDVIDVLVQDYGAINPSWRVSLRLIADWYKVYVDAKKDIDDNGLMMTNRRGETARNASIITMQNASNNVVSLLKAFAATPMSKTKMKALDKEAVVDDQAFIDALMQ